MVCGKVGKMELSEFLDGVEFGSEIETTLGRDCDRCDYCLICDNCPVCESCRGYNDFCSQCDIEEIKEYMVEHGYLDDYDGELDNLDRETICDICIKHGIWEEVICEYCGRCENCDYIYDNEYCPLDSYDVDLPKELWDYIEDTYIDEPCGLEIVTETFSDLMEFRNFLKEIVEHVGYDNMSPYNHCGGHFNISWDYWKDYYETVFNNSRVFIDLLSYMFNEHETYYRDGYKDFPLNITHSDGKFTAIHRKSYAIEYRFLDSPRDVDNYILAAATIMAICKLKYILLIDDITERKTQVVYDYIHKYGDDLDDELLRHLKDKFKLLIRTCGRYLREISEIVGIDLIKALEWRFKYPKYQEPKHNKTLNLDNFKLNQKPTIVEDCAKTMSLKAYGIV